MTLSREQEAELLDEAEAAFRVTQALLAVITRTRYCSQASAPIDLLLKHGRPAPRCTSYPAPARAAQRRPAGVGPEDLEDIHGRWVVGSGTASGACWVAACRPA